METQVTYMISGDWLWLRETPGWLIVGCGYNWYKGEVFSSVRLRKVDTEALIEAIKQSYPTVVVERTFNTEKPTGIRAGSDLMISWPVPTASDFFGVRLADGIDVVLSRNARVVFDQAQGWV